MEPNPIAIKLLEKVKSRTPIFRTCPKCAHQIYMGRSTKAFFAFICEVTSATLENVFSRPRVSYSMRKILKYNGLIDERDEFAYEDWLMQNGIELETRGGKWNRGKRKHKKRIEPEFEESPE